MALLKSDIEALRKLKLTIQEARRIRALRDYQAIKKKFFGIAVPDVSSVSIVFISSKIMSKYFRSEETVGCNLSGIGAILHIIAIDEDSTDSEYLMTLIHEMAHLKIDEKWKRRMGHGKHWQNEMKRLAIAGAFEPLW